MVGPYNVGSTLVLTCDIIGGGTIMNLLIIKTIYLFASKGGPRLKCLGGETVL